MKIVKKELSTNLTVDIETSSTHTYCLGNGMISHNTTGLLSGTTPGVHYPESPYYIRRVRLAKNSPLIPPLQKAGYKIEPAVGQESSTVVVEFPCESVQGVRGLKDVSMWEQLDNAALVQKWWADNGVSVTITFGEDEKKDIPNFLEAASDKLKAVSMLPRLEQGAYAQMPYEEITKARYEDMLLSLNPLDFSAIYGYDSEGEKYCSNDSCSI